MAKYRVQFRMILQDSQVSDNQHPNDEHMVSRLVFDMAVDGNPHAPPAMSELAMISGPTGPATAPTPALSRREREAEKAECQDPTAHPSRPG